MRLLFLFTATLCAAADPVFYDVFHSAGKDGYASIRIPSLVVTKKGALVAFAEGRQRPADQAENDIVTKRSTDGGRTWGALSVIHEDGIHSLNNPTAVVEQSTGRIYLMYQRIPGHLKEHSKGTATGYEGEEIYRTFLVQSADDGLTWSKPLDITRGTKREARATTVCSGPGVAIQLTRGAHKGRIVVPFNEGPFWLWQNYAAFSDDAGLSWHFGVDAPGAMLPDKKLGQRSQVNEVQMVELSDGSVRLDSRQFAGAKVRKTAISADGGQTWSSVADLPDLPCPSCMAGIARFSFDDGPQKKGRILHTGPVGKREHGTVYLSYDDGATFPVKRELYAGSFAYSLPVRLADGQVGVFFEADNYSRIALAVFPIEWLESSATPPQK